MTKQIGLMQKHILNKTRTETKGVSMKPTYDKVREPATERFSLEWLFQNLKKIARDHLHC